MLSELLLAVLAAALSWSLVGLYRRAMTAARKLEKPNERSMHQMPVPTGAGVGIVAAVLALWLLWHGGVPDHGSLPLLASLAGLGVLSWLDDRYPLSPAVRMAGHALAVGLCLWSLPSDARALPALPLGVERALEAAAWLWFVNLFNFMDGIDGLAGSEAVAIAVGYLGVLAVADLESPFWGLALILAAATAGYLYWNWHPAKVFMGDAGAIPLGFLLGWLMLDLAVRGHLAAAAILPAYFAADATITLVRRTLAGKPPWRAHREHYYQRAVLGGTPPSAVVARIAAVDLLLVALALLSASRPVPALIAAAVLIALLLAHLESLARKPAL
jgi:UDP-N-acetylmuramyl pentapeptide phosphotransferase/UDP-N-acetylglucosamine-1-phosphate transferase